MSESKDKWVNSPDHYNSYSIETIAMMEKIYGRSATAMFCEMSAFKYRMRMGTKPGQPMERELEKEAWYLEKVKELMGEDKLSWEI